jgi:hypothetical protein
MKYLLITITLFSFSSLIYSQEQENLILVTLDGVRWQEIFYGIDPNIIIKLEKTTNKIHGIDHYAEDSINSSRQNLCPFIWHKLNKFCQISGNRVHNNRCDVKNNYWFSYPGYNEMLTGKNDPKINSNAKVYNKNKTILEKLNQQEFYKNQIAVFSSWEVFPYILNNKRSGLMINSGNNDTYNKMTGTSPLAPTVNNDSKIPRKDYRPDKTTYELAKSYLQTYKPKILFLALNDTDEFAHQGKYDEYLHSIHRADSILKDLWETIGTMDEYNNKTALIITTDHGRGYNFSGSWRNHGRSISGSDHIWYITNNSIPGIFGENKDPNQFFLAQVADQIKNRLLNKSK